jgi:hypothetical protein
MAFDYVNTTPWNDPLNPYPKYTQVALSGSVVDSGSNVVNINCILTMFSLNNPADTFKVQYGNNDVVAGGCYLYYYSDASIKSWYIQYNNTNPQYIANTGEESFYMKRDVPYIYTEGVVGPWVDAAGTGIDHLTLTPVLSSLAGWEKRRIAGGTG